MPVTVVVAVEHPAVREGACAVLGHVDGVRLVGEADTLRRAVRMVRELQPEVLVLGSRFAGVSSLPELSQFSEAAPGTRIVLVSMNDSPDYARHVRALGADALVQTDRLADDLEPVVHAVRAARRQPAHA